MTAVYPGSFDPVTCGHIDVIRRAAKLFDRLIVGVLDNKKKMPLFTPEERVNMLRETVGMIPGVEIRIFEGLATEFAGEYGAAVMIRGVRGTEDFGSELQLARINRRLAPGIDTVFLPAGPEQSLISSSGAKEIAAFGGDLSGFVPPPVQEKLKEKYRR